MVPPPCSCNISRSSPQDEAELSRPPWLARRNPSSLKEALTKAPIEFNKPWAGFSASKGFICLLSPTHWSPFISFGLPGIRAYKTSPRSRRKFVAEAEEHTLDSQPEPPSHVTFASPLAFTSQERSSQATDAHTHQHRCT